jgi:hypothetical protein
VRGPDVAFSVDLHGLRATLGAADRERIAKEAGEARRAHGDAGVLAAELADLSLTEASLRNHGRRFHELVIAPLAAKFVPGGGDRTLARWRRKAWMPLFWPQTLEEACRGGRIAFAPRRLFHTLRPGGTGVLLDRLLERLQQRGVTAEGLGALEGLDRQGDATVLRFAEGTVTAERPVIGLSAEELFGAAYAPEKVRSAIAWLAIDAADLDRPTDLLHDHDADSDVARISRGDGDVWTVELRHDLPAEQLVAAARAGLERAGIVGDGEAAHPITQGAMPTFAMPDARTRAAFERAAAEFAARDLNLELVGGALDVAADSLNEQVVQALRTVEHLT